VRPGICTKPGLWCEKKEEMLNNGCTTNYKIIKIIARDLTKYLINDIIRL
jgi:hypothetical protein